MTAAAHVMSNIVSAVESNYGLLSHPASELTSWTPPPMAEGHKGRYLWTDAFGVLSFLTLFKETSDDRYLSYAKRLVTTVHDILGRTRDGTARLPGATDDWPLRGGLRIGKHSTTGDDADGQYFHYITLWAFALNRTALASGEKWYNDQAISLAKTVHPRFMVNRQSSRPRMYWKMSMDLSHPLVKNEGNLDPIDGYVVYSLLQRTAGTTELAEEIRDYRRILETKVGRYNSDDPLDLGMTLWTAHWLKGEEGEEWATWLSDTAFICLDELWESGYFTAAARYRLAFREFGTALGIRCQTETSSRTGGISPEEWERRTESITQFWEGEQVVPKPKKAMRKEGLECITCVMYASAIYPGAFRKGYFGKETI